MRSGRTVSGAVLAVACAVLAACQAGPGGGPGGGPSGDALPVVTTTTVFADMVRQVGGDLVSVTSLVPNDGDVHTFEPRPADLFTVARARLLVMNGLGLDDWLERTITNVAADGTPLVRLAVDLPGVQLLPGDSPDSQNPHLWLDPGYARLYAGRIAAALEAADPAHASAYATLAGAYDTRLQELDAEVRAKIATVPEADRRIVLFHDAFPYYARAYGITIVGVAVPAPGQDPRAGDIAQLITAIRAAHVKAIFSEKQFPTKLVDELAAQTGARVVADLYDDSLGGPVTSYEAVITWDTDQLVAALR